METTMKIDGVKVRDAHKPLSLRISKRDAATGQKDPNNCAAAKAALRLQGVKEARVYRSTTYLKVEKSTGGEEWLRYMTPDSLKSEIVAFDRGGTFEPGEYDLVVPSPGKQLGYYRERDPNRAGGPKKSRRSPHVIKNIRERANGLSNERNK